MRVSCSRRNSRIEYLKCNLICIGKNIRDWNVDRLLYIGFIEFHRLILIIGHVDVHVLESDRLWYITGFENLPWNKYLSGRK